MGKGLSLVIFLFFILVILNVLVTSFVSVSSHRDIARGIFLASRVSGIGISDAASSPPAYLKVSLFEPNGSVLITQGYGHTPYSYMYPNQWHDGIDIGASYGEAVYSLSDGMVVATGNQDDYCFHKGFGRYLAIKDPINDLILWYAHLGNINVVSGQKINRGQNIATVGATGLETGIHLHLSLFQANTFTMQPRNGCGLGPTGQDLDPMQYLGSVYR